MMHIKSLYYNQYIEDPKFWELNDCTFGDINLIVGRNATGKSKTLRIINSLSILLLGLSKLTFLSGNYQIRFDNNGDEIYYALKYVQQKIINEEFSIGGKVLLKRGIDGAGSIFFSKENDYFDFQTPQNELASVSRRDNVQHPYLQCLYDWAKSVRFYQFGTSLGKEELFLKTKEDITSSQTELDPRMTNAIAQVYMDGERIVGNNFKLAILNDMGLIDYQLDDIGIEYPDSLVGSGLIKELVGLYVKESDLLCNTNQIEMSVGMFRALSLIIQINYSLFTGKPSCILIDDIGEGLDFERSSSLVKLLIERAQNSTMQMIMTTNDRFIMNNVPLEYWSIIERKKNSSRIYNQRNAPNIFNDFKFTGLNNFDFFSSNYYLKGK